MKLSELKEDTLVCVGSNNSIMSKSDYVITAERFNGPVYLAVEVNIKFCLEDAIENQIEDEAYEDCIQDVMYDLNKRETMNTKEIEAIINQAIKNNPTYEKGEEIEIDI